MSGGMKLGDLDFKRLLPAFMRDDGAVTGLSLALNEIVPQLEGSIQTLSTWDSIDLLSEEELDALAWELNILWYDVGANIDTKRDVIKNSDLVYRRLGTKWAVESVIKSYFGDGYITEWFEYGGQPGRFRVYTANPSVSEERYGEFLNLLEKIKRASAKFDGLYITLTGQMPLYAGMAVHQSGRECYEIGATL